MLNPPGPWDMAMGDLFVRAAVVAVRIPKLKGGKWRNGNVEVALATGRFRG